jgi:hypothetical protein
MAVKLMESMEMDPGVIPHPGRVPEQRLLSPEIDLQRRWRCRPLSRKTPIDVGFLRQRLNIGGGAMLESTQGPHTLGWHTQGSTRATTRCGRPWPPSDSSLDSVLCRGKIGTLGFVLSNSKNISCVTFLKHKNSRKHGTGTMASR